MPSDYSPHTLSNMPTDLAAIQNLPSVLGVGVDLIKESRVKQTLEKFGDRFVRRILTEPEWQVFQNKQAPVNYLAKAFAAKEALVKALGTGFQSGVSFQDFSILRDEKGSPQVSVTGVAATRMSEAGGKQLLVSLSDEGDLVFAFALMTR